MFEPSASSSETELPLIQKVLLYLTTSPWRHLESVSPQIEALLAEMKRMGWRIRLATPRNYLLWRHWLHGQRRKFPVLVLAHPLQAFTVPELNVLFATDLFDARKRCLSESGEPLHQNDEAILDRFCRDVVTPMSGLAVISRRQILAEAEQKLTEALYGYS